MWGLKQSALIHSVVLISFASIIQCQRYDGDICYHNIKQLSGVCKKISDCPSAMKELQAGVFPQTCGFDGTLPIVCCASVKETVTPSTTTRRPTTRTTTRTTSRTTTKRPSPAVSYKVGQRSLQKCNEYKEYAYVEEISPVLTFQGGSEKQSECPFDKVELIVGGVKAKRDEFPHMALIGYNNGNQKKWDCGGTLLSDFYVMTAAHCLNSREYGEPVVVKLGDLNITDPGDDKYVQQIDIADRIPHPEYRYPSVYNDIALLRLKRKVSLGLSVRPACLFTGSTVPSPKIIATGWGLTDYGGDQSDYLLKVVLEFFTAVRCNKTYSNEKRALEYGIVDRTQLCAGSDTYERDTCQGDSGGPIQLYSNTLCMYDIVGVTSFGKNCGIVGIPAVYTRIYPYLEWLENTIWPSG